MGTFTPNDLVGTNEAATILGVSISTVNRWAVEGVLTVALKAPGNRGANLFARTDVEALVEQRKAEALAPCSRCGALPAGASA